MNKKHIIRILPFVLLITLSLVSISAVCGVFARYTFSKEGDINQAEPEKFYLECNFEDEGVYLVPEGKDFSFIVYNYDVFDHTTESELKYTVKVDGVALGEDAYTFAGGEKSEKTFIIPSSQLEADKTYKIDITSSSPFAKTISFDIRVVTGELGNYYTVKDNGNWVQLDLYIGTNPPNSLTIKYGANLAPDNTNSLMRTWLSTETERELTNVNLHSYSHYTLIFFGTQAVTEVAEKTPLPAEIVLPQ